MANSSTNFEAIIIGGSYAGLSAAMALGRAMRKILIIDGGRPCNRFTPHSHNFITQDGVAPARIAAVAKEQVLYYPTVKFTEGFVTKISRQGAYFTVETEDENFSTGKLLLATGIQDVLPEIEGIADCWGKSILHCPYCHGYEVRNQGTGILGKGDLAFHQAMLLSNWTDRLTIFTNGAATFTEDQESRLRRHNIAIVEEGVAAVIHEHGYVKGIQLHGGSVSELSAMYLKPGMQQNPLCEMLGCDLTDAGYIKTDDFKRTSVGGIFAAGDNTSMMRSVSAAVAAGNAAGAFINHDLTAENF